MGFNCKYHFTQTFSPLVLQLTRENSLFKRKAGQIPSCKSLRNITCLFLFLEFACTVQRNAKRTEKRVKTCLTRQTCYKYKASLITLQDEFPLHRYACKNKINTQTTNLGLVTLASRFHPTNFLETAVYKPRILPSLYLSKCKFTQPCVNLTIYRE